MELWGGKVGLEKHTKKNPKLIKAKARPSTIKNKSKLILGTGQLANLFKNVNKTVGKFT